MIINKKNYSNATEADLCLYLEERNESILCGAYEYFVNGAFGHRYKRITLTRSGLSNSYTGTIYSDGDVSITRDTYEWSTSPYLFRRDTNTLNDELLRYAEHCRWWVVWLYYRLKYEVDNYKKTGIYSHPTVPQMYKEVRPLICGKLDSDPYYAVECKKKVEKHYDTLGLCHPFVGKVEVWYAFVSPFASQEERDLEPYYRSHGIPVDNRYWLKREKIHFKYLDDLLKKTKKLSFNSVPKSDNPLASAGFVVPIIILSITLIVTILMLLVLGGAIKIEGFSGAMLTIGFTTLPIIAIISLIVMIRKISKYVDWKNNVK